MSLGASRRQVVVAVTRLLLCALLAATACRPTPARDAALVAFDDVPASLDPHLQNHFVAGSVLGNICDALLRFSPTMQLEPALAIGWELLDERTWSIKLRPGVRFHDGSLFTAADVVHSLERARLHPGSLVKHYLVGVERIEAVDELTVELQSTGPAPDLLNRLTFVLIVPEETAGDAEIIRPVGTGPYRYVEQRADGSLVVEAVQGWRGLAEVRSARFVFFEDGSSAADELLAGRVDLLHIVPDDRIAAVTTRPDLMLVPQPRLAVQLLRVVPGAASGRTREALEDVRVRRALLLALNRTEWVNSVFRGNATVASQYVHPVVFGYDPGIGVERHDRVEARRLLVEAGFADGFDVTLGHGFANPGTIAAIVEDLAAIGVRVHVRAAPFQLILEEARGGALPLVFYAWACSTGDASDFLNSSVHSRRPDSGLGAENYSGYSDPETDALIGLAEVEREPEARRGLLQRAQRRALAAHLVLPLTTPWAYLGVSRRLVVESRHDDRIWLASYRWRT